MPFFERPNAKLFYQDTEGAGPCVVFSHGIFMNHRMFDSQVEALSGDFRCVAWDERWHGRSETKGPYDYWDLADDLLGLLDHLDVEHALLAGMSQGGFLSLRAALRAPERVDGLFLIDTQAGVEEPQVIEMYKTLHDQWTQGHGTDEMIDMIGDFIVSPADTTPWKEEWRTYPNEQAHEPFQCLVTRDDITDRLPEIDAPALVVHGSADMAVPQERARALCEGLASCEGFHLIEGGGHAANLSHPREINELLLDFAKRHAG